MEASNHFCDTPNCRYPAEKFAITNTAKIRVCSIHISNLIEKRLTIYDMEAFNFIESAADLPLYETRRTEAQVGIGNLTVLEAACDKELREALEAIEKSKLKAVQVTEAAYELNKIKAKRKYQETNDHFQAIRNSLKRYRQGKEAQLSPAEQALLHNLACVPRFLRAVVIDSSLPLAQTAVNSWKSSDLSTEDTLLLLDAEIRGKFLTDLVDKAEFDWSNELAEVSEEEKQYAKSLGYPEDLELHMEKVAITRKKKLVKLLELTLNEEEVRQVASYYQEKASKEFIQGEKTGKEMKSGASYSKKAAQTEAAQQYEKSIKYWDKALHLLELRLPRDKQTAITSFEYGKFLWEQWDPHSKVSILLRESLEIQQGLNPYSEETEKATILLIKALFNENKTQQAIELIKSALETLSVHDSSNQFCNVLHCLLAWINSYTRSTEETEKELSNCLFMQQDSDHEYSALCSKALGFAYNTLRRYAEAEKQIEAALTFYQRYFPESFHIPSTLLDLGKVYTTMKRYEDANKMYQCALVKLKTNFPTSKQVAVALAHIGQLCRAMKKYADAKTAYTEVLEMYEARSSQSEDIAKTYHALALVFQDSSSTKQAETYFSKAFEIFLNLSLSTDSAVEALQDFLRFYYCIKKLKPTEILQKPVIEIALNSFPTSELIAELYYYLGSVLVESEQYQEAEQMWNSALQIFRINSHISLKTARMLFAMGRLYERMKHMKEAETMYENALTIYEGYFPDFKEKADLVLRLAKMYRSMKRHKEAFEIYRAYFPTSENTAHIALELAKQYNTAKNYECAELMYRNALTIFKNISSTSNDTLNTLTTLGQFYFAYQRYPEAEPVLLEALRVARTQTSNPKAIQQLKELAYPRLQTLYSISNQPAKLAELKKQISLL